MHGAPALLPGTLTKDPTMTTRDERRRRTFGIEALEWRNAPSHLGGGGHAEDLRRDKDSHGVAEVSRLDSQKDASPDRGGDPGQNDSPSPDKGDR
jgi:hypothetical protein